MPGKSSRDSEFGDHARSRACTRRGRPAIWHSPAGKTHKRALIAVRASGVPYLEAETSYLVDEQLFCEHRRWSAIKCHEAVYREPETCVNEPISTDSIRPMPRHNRDVNAAKNIEAVGLTVLACGGTVRHERVKAPHAGTVEAGSTLP